MGGVGCSCICIALAPGSSTSLSVSDMCLRCATKIQSATKVLLQCLHPLRDAIATQPEPANASPSLLDLSPNGYGSDRQTDRQTDR